MRPLPPDQSIHPPPAAGPVAVPHYVRAKGTIRASFGASHGRTHPLRIHEAGGLRLRHPRTAAGYEGTIVNTAGGVAGGDAAVYAFACEAGSDVTLTTQSAEKIYRAQNVAATIDVSLAVAPGARLAWLPQETILFEGARLRRRLEADVAPDAALLLVETLVFGRLARGETSICGTIQDGWRVRRGGRLVFAEAMRLDGALGAALDRSAVGDGARATALLLHAAPDAMARLEGLRDACAPHMADAPHGASAWNGLLVARFASASPQRLRAAILSAISCLGCAVPRVWQS
jgi:urease accessory protein